VVARSVNIVATRSRDWGWVERVSMSFSIIMKALIFPVPSLTILLELFTA
jgi:hypothetical protein